MRESGKYDSYWCEPSRRVALGGLLGLLTQAPAGASDRDELPNELRMAFSEKGLFELNPADAKVALAVWTRRLGERMGVKLTTSPKVFDSTAEIKARLEAKTVDTVAINPFEYLEVAAYLDPSKFLIEGTPKERQYVLLAKKGSGIETAAALQGRRLSLWGQPRMTVAREWLSTLLYEGKRKPYEPFAVNVTEESKAMRAVLAVFFDKADACLTSQATFDGIVELNPQVGKQMNVIAVSPAFVTSMYMFRRGFSITRRDYYLKILSNMENDPGLQQVMSLFKSGALFVVDPGAMKETLAVMEAAKGLRRGATTGRGRDFQ